MDPILCNSCGARFPRTQFTDDECEALKDRRYGEGFSEELQMLEKVQAYYRRHPEAEGTIKPDVERMLESDDPGVREQLFVGVPFHEIALPAADLPAALTESAEDAEVVEYLRHHSFELGPRLEFVSAQVSRLAAVARPLSCPSCQAGALSVPKENWEAFEEASANSVTWYWPEWHSVGMDGTLTMHCSGWSGDAHWSGAHIVGPDRADYPFWRWLAEQPKFRRGVGSAELPAIKAEWSRSSGNDG